MSYQSYQSVPKSILIECQSTIKELKAELEHALKMNGQKEQIIKILTEEKQFYLQQNRKFDQNTYGKLKQQIHWNTTLTQGLKQHNKELTQKCKFLTQANEGLLEEMQEKDVLLKEMTEQVNAVKHQKMRLEKQWSQTLVCVRKKIFELNSAKPQIITTADQNKGNNRISKAKPISQKQQTRIQHAKQPLGKSNKVESILDEIDNKLLNYEFLEMIKSKQTRNNHKAVFLREQEHNKQNIQSLDNYSAMENFDQV